MKHRIYFSISSEGYGHSSRDIAIAKILEASSAKVLFGSSDYVLERLKKNFDTVEIEKEIEMTGNNGTSDTKANIHHNKAKALRCIGAIENIYARKIFASYRRMFGYNPDRRTVTANEYEETARNETSAGKK